MPRPGTPTLHPDMLDRVRTAVTGAQTARCELLGALPPRGPFDPDSGQHSQPQRPVLWTGSCRVQRQTRQAPNQVDAAGKPLVITGYQVTVPMTAPNVGVERVRIIAAPDDPAMVDVQLVVNDRAVGQMQGERLLLCERA